MSYERMFGDLSAGHQARLVRRRKPSQMDANGRWALVGVLCCRGPVPLRQYFAGNRELVLAFGKRRSWRANLPACFLCVVCDFWGLVTIGALHEVARWLELVTRCFHTQQLTDKER